jgi:NADPH-dependent 2,4-dienoyl-CoA reductase/sulfur reductase-like enzyme
VADIAEMVALFAKAAKRAKQAGFDAVEIHGAHRYLIAQFLSPTWNKRQDEYGGELKNRARILIETIRAVRQAVGEKYPLTCRLNGKEYGVEGGTTLEEAQEVARMAEEAGVNAIHVSAWGVRSQIQAASLPTLPGALVPLAEGIKKVVTIPVIAVGRISPELGERVLQDGKADFVAIGRALIVDPELPNKVARGKLEDIRPCTACMACRDGLLSGGELQCMVNPAVGREHEHPVRPAEKRKKVLIVGGGPAGMEAARVAASRGHEVILCEKEERLGGQLVVGAIPPHKGRIEPLTNYLVIQVKKLGVRVELGKEITLTAVQELKPDVVVLATGVLPLVPDIPGIDSINVVNAEDILNGKVVTGGRVIVLGGELVGCETAEFLAEKGKKVTITRRGLSMATKVGPSLRERLLDRLAEKGVTMLTGVKYDAITERGLAITTSDGRKETIEADTIVLATGSKANRELLTGLKGMVSEIHLVGDCVEPRGIREAIDEGFRIACVL